MLNFETAGDDYRAGLETLLRELSSEHASPMREPARSLPDTNLLWQIPALCKSTSFFIYPQYTKKRCKDTQAAQRFLGSASNHTDDIWGNHRLQSWLSSGNPSLLLLQGTSQSVKRLESFGLELVEHLEDKGPVVFVLGAAFPLSFKFSEPDGGALGALSHVAIQALVKISTLDPVPDVLSKNPRLFLARLSATSSELLQIGTGSEFLRAFFALGREHTKSLEWPTDFAALVEKLKAQILSSSPKVLLINCHPFRHGDGTLESNTVRIASSLAVPASTSLRQKAAAAARGSRDTTSIPAGTATIDSILYSGLQDSSPSLTTTTSSPGRTQPSPPGLTRENNTTSETTRLASALGLGIETS
ncbi:hypothetical protein B0T19DRAFT_24330 [Cercophora scortea]|uniref:Uncharacterized protein n=1 Tax=Cercophora scortea TaxID=314031 RepID=A0AAE0J2W9_9PEZI|nr:hypothetical protein B0T19DRAFT_24330 [Cercophora scortea]